MGLFVGKLRLTPHPEPRHWWRRRAWRLTPPFGFESTRHNITVRIDEPFDTDLASSPRWLPACGAILLVLAATGWGLGWIDPAISYWVKVAAAVLGGILVTFGAVASMVGAEGAVIHDKLYRVREHPQWIADDIFWECLIDMGVPAPLARCMYYGVRLLGWSAYPKTAQPMTWNADEEVSRDWIWTLASWAVILAAAGFLAWTFWRWSQ